jgi:superfamily I DNA and/or RNA helicase
MDILGGKVSPEVDGKALESAWATLFFVIPVVSTTFASFDRLFSHCGRESLGWLLIDEAGQATPQSAAGALWRSRRAVIVGDPRQLEPIVSLPFTAQQALRAHFGVEETWLPSKNSAQTLADRVSRFGTWLQSENPEELIWVGSPLRVHRRCEKPMFEISNEIAYNRQMVYDTQEIPSLLPPSSWIDVGAAESDEHWIPAEGVVLDILLTDLLRCGVNRASILLISPFRAVARKLKDIATRHGIAQAGTIHVSQGKEADIVILVLGGDRRRLGARDWASEKPNLLNVAVSRAKRRLFVIGNREEWNQYPNFADASALLIKKENLWA